MKVQEAIVKVSEPVKEQRREEDAGSKVHFKEECWWGVVRFF